MGGLINETPVLCGGRDSTGSDVEIYDSCIVFRQTKTSIKMKQKRYSAASVMVNETTLLIMGGSSSSADYHGDFDYAGDYYDSLNSTELITLDANTKCKRY